MDVCHFCDNPPCVNPAHLFIGTRSENMHDAGRKGSMRRDTRGMNNGRAKLTPDTVEDIRTKYAAGISQDRLAALFGIGQTQVSRIVRREHWST